MELKLEDFKTGWFGLSIALTDQDIARLIQRLEEIRASKGHFHIRSAFKGSGGIGDIEHSWSPPAKASEYSIE